MRTDLRRRRSLSLACFISLVLGAGFGVEAASAASPSNDKEVLWSQQCIGWERTLTPNTRCVYGDRTSHTVIALVGDSHASHLFPAIERLAKLHHWKLVVLVKVSCGFADMPVRNVALGRTYRECVIWNRNVVRRLAVLKPTLTVVVNSRNAMHATRAADSSNGAKGRAVGRMLAKVPGRVAIVIDSPVARQPRAGYLAMGAIEKIAATSTGARLIDLTRATCSSWPCPAKVGHITKFRDHSHFTATFSRTILGVPGGALDRALTGLLP